MAVDAGIWKLCSNSVGAFAGETGATPTEVTWRPSSTPLDYYCNARPCLTVAMLSYWPVARLAVHVHRQENLPSWTKKTSSRLQKLFGPLVGAADAVDGLREICRLAPVL